MPSTLQTLFVTKLPWPPVGGEHLRSWQNINILSELGPVHVFSIFRYDYDTNGIDQVKSWHSYNVNRKESVWDRIDPILWWIQKRGLWDYWPYRLAAAKQLEKLLIEINPDIVVVEELWLYPYLSVIQRHACAVIFDHHNVEAPLFFSTKCKGNGLRGWLRSQIHLPQIKADESRFMRQAHQTWVCSENDKAQLKGLYGAAIEGMANRYSSRRPKKDLSKTHVIPNAIDLTDYDHIRLAACSFPSTLNKSCKYVLYLGNFGYVPNAEAADVLIDHIYPRLHRDYPDSRLLLVGREPTLNMLEAAKRDETIIVTGQVIDVKPYLAAGSVMVVPLQRGSGTRFKILEAFAAHCPVVSTAKGAEGLQVEDKKHLLIRQSVEEIADGVLQLWARPIQARAIAASAYELVRAEYSWEAAGKRAKEALSSLFPSLDPS